MPRPELDPSIELPDELMGLDELDPEADISERIMESVVPYFANEKKSRFLSYRFGGYTTKEACKIIGISESTVTNWFTSDPVFKEMASTTNMKKRRSYTAEYMRAEFLRNYRLLLAKDHKVITIALKAPKNLNKQDWNYLFRRLGHYTPQQLLSVEELVTQTDPESVGFSELILSIRKVKVLKKSIGEESSPIIPEMASIEGQVLALAPSAFPEEAISPLEIGDISRLGEEESSILDNFLAQINKVT